jgi:hypothetical protein
MLPERYIHGKKAVLVTVGGTLVLGLAVSLYLFFANAAEDNHITEQGSSNSQRLYDTESWITPGELSVRYVDSTSSAFFIRLDQNDIVYKYIDGASTLERYGVNLWNHSTEEARRCGYDLLPLQLSPYINEDARLIVGGNEVHTAGQIVLAFAGSPSGIKLAVVSADGPKKGSLLPGGGYVAYGVHYYEIFSVPDMKLMTKAVPLPFSAEALELCWLSNEKYVVLINVLRSHLSVVNNNNIHGK